MTKISLDISGKVSSAHLKAISAIKKIADGLGIKFFVVGATARDFVLTCLYGVKAPRMTLDIDFGVEIKDWGSYVKIEKGLIESGQFKQSKEKQRFVFEDTIIDIIPFGDISNNKNQISWPPDYSVIMSVSGFEEACQHATNIILNQDPYLEILVPTLPGLAVLKILSWKHSYPERQKDAEDLLFIINNYEHTDIMDRIFNESVEILESEAFDYKMASIRILGQDMAKICTPVTVAEVKDIFIKETSRASQFHLVAHMMNTNHEFDDILVLLLKLKKGFLEMI
ncbi:MAG: nucleotidyl transferase AbiEii/AbiGii toxin family protein [Proteobacteria bacterium]|nr:nucleotidyl transferase AbiEii/AbiGii toxin family protein [Pseudomonadota bacterium]